MKTRAKDRKLIFILVLILGIVIFSMYLDRNNIASNLSQNTDESDNIAIPPAKNLSEAIASLSMVKAIHDRDANTRKLKTTIVDESIVLQIVDILSTSKIVQTDGVPYLGLQFFLEAYDKNDNVIDQISVIRFWGKNDEEEVWLWFASLPQTVYSLKISDADNLKRLLRL